MSFVFCHRLFYLKYTWCRLSYRQKWLGLQQSRCLTAVFFHILCTVLLEIWWMNLNMVKRVKWSWEYYTKLRTSSLRNVNSVIIYSSCHSTPIIRPFILQYFLYSLIIYVHPLKVLTTKYLFRKLRNVCVTCKNKTHWLSHFKKASFADHIWWLISMCVHLSMFIFK